MGRLKSVIVLFILCLSYYWLSSLVMLFYTIFYNSILFSFKLLIYSYNSTHIIYEFNITDCLQVILYHFNHSIRIFNSEFPFLYIQSLYCHHHTFSFTSFINPTIPCFTFNFIQFLTLWNLLFWRDLRW